MSFYLKLILYLIISQCNSIILYGEQNISAPILDYPFVNISVAVTINTDTDTVDIDLGGPYGKWFGIGFGQSTMNNSYAIVITSYDAFAEYKLKKGYGGISVSQMAEQVAFDSFSNGYRILKVQRSRIGITNDHYTFPNTVTDIDIIWSYGYETGQTFAYHGTAQEQARGSSSLSLGSLSPTASPTGRPTTSLEASMSNLETKCNFINHGWNGPLATDSCMKSVDYGTSLLDSFIYECEAESNSIIAKGFYCNGENCIGTIDNCDRKGLLDSAVYTEDSNTGKTEKIEMGGIVTYWNCEGTNNCDKVTVKYTCCIDDCYNKDRYEVTYIQNMCWRRYNFGVILRCENGILIIDEYEYNNCSELVSSAPYDKESHMEVAGWEAGFCSDLTYVCSNVDTKYISLYLSVLMFFFAFLCVY